MVTAKEHKDILTAIDKLLVSNGESINRWRVGTFSAKQILLDAGMPNIENNWRYVAHVIKIHYPDSTWERGSHDEGIKARIRIRVK